MTVESWARDEVGTLLDRARDAGEAMGIGAIREEVGIGHGDLEEVLNELREAGEAVEATPGEWRRPFDDEVPGAAEPGELLHVHESSEETLAEAEERAGGRPAPAPASRPSPAASVAADVGEVRLTMAVASALEAETIGKLVEAGIAEAKEQARAFVLRVEP